MNVRLNTPPVCLARNQALTLTRAEGALISCVRGTLWITQHGDLRDIVLKAGESFSVDRSGPATVWALADSGIDVRPAHPPRRRTGTVQRWLERAAAALGSVPVRGVGVAEHVH